MRQHYHLLIGSPGCMPDVNEYYTTRRGAEVAARGYADQERDVIALNAEAYPEARRRVLGNARDGYTVTWGDWGSGYRMWIEACLMHDCEEGE